ncbi:hypothetical protein HDU96_001535 [Phlyctochytrium bullatum]|nr:hypothetical protein HDU96_001535 [Phlyctochytrium bullatum]
MELSLCGRHPIFQGVTNSGKSLKDLPEEKRKLFEDQFRSSLLTFDEFAAEPGLIYNPDLLVRINGGAFYDWTSASLVLASLCAFGKMLPDNTFQKLQSRLAIDNTGQEPKKYSSFSEGLRFWWNRGGAGVGDMPDGGNSQPGSRKQAPPPSQRVESDPNQLKSLNLKKGVNTITFAVTSTLQGTATCTSKIFFWDHNVKVVISDVDGTITKSDALGHLFTMVGRDWTHSGVASLYTNIRRNGYQILYLTSRAIGQYNSTRDYLMKIEQGSYQLPDGPVIMSPDRLFTALHREVIQRKPEIFKIAALRDIKSLFGDAKPFYAGFGNRITDALAYRAVHVPPSRIFTIDPSGEVKLELLSSYKSSYIKLNDIVDQIFPDVSRGIGDGYGDFEFWRQPMPEIDHKDDRDSASVSDIRKPLGPATSAPEDTEQGLLEPVDSDAEDTDEDSGRESLAKSPEMACRSIDARAMDEVGWAVGKEKFRTLDFRKSMEETAG